MSFYVCHSFNEYDPKKGYFFLKTDCIEWNEDISGSWHGPKYSSLEECYSKSVCIENKKNNFSLSNNNNYCNIYINNVTLKHIDSAIIIVEIDLPEQYTNTYIEYAFYDTQLQLLSDFKRLTSLSTTLPKSFQAEISVDQLNVCVVAFRLVKPCNLITESGQEWQLFDLSSWNNITSVMPLKTYLDEAAANWNNILKYNDQVFSLYKQAQPTWNGLSLAYYEEINDPSAGFIAACGPIGSIDIVDNDPLNIKRNAITFQLYVNTYYNSPEWGFTDSDWINVLTHELGHALGIGIYWDIYNNFWLDGNKYSQASLAYNAIIGDLSNNRSLLPLEDSGGVGTQSAHWENNDRLDSYTNSDGYSYPGCIFDIMIGFFTVGNPKPISNLSKDFLLDIGYELTALTTEPQPLFKPEIVNNNSIGATISNMCGVNKKCGCDSIQNLGQIDMINKKFISSQ